MLVNELFYEFYFDVIMVVEDVFGMLVFCLLFLLGGVGFDYRFVMVIFDMWIKIFKEKKDEEWDIGNIIFIFINCCYGEKMIVYVESYD